jgi:predicted enzyme related to lactoylglutathione lyase
MNSARFQNGVPCWADISPTDMDVARAFYSAVLGWDIPPGTEAFGGYTTATAGDAGAAGFMPNDGSVPTAWNLYFASDDAAATQSAIQANGGTVLVPVDSVGDFGRMVIAADPTGAVFGVWQSDTMVGFEAPGQVGGWVWCDLRSSDPDRARAFYSAVFGYTYQPMEMASPDYETFWIGDETIGGMGGMMGAPEGTPSHWLVYFAVTDVDAAVGAATATGGMSLMPPFDTPFGRMGPIIDPDGAPLWLVQLP